MPVVLSKILTKKKTLTYQMLVQWLEASKIALNVNKTDIVSFWSLKKTNH